MAGSIDKAALLSVEPSRSFETVIRTPKHVSDAEKCGFHPWAPKLMHDRTATSGWLNNGSCPELAQGLGFGDVCARCAALCGEGAGNLGHHLTLSVQPRTLARPVMFQTGVAKGINRSSAGLRVQLEAPWMGPEPMEIRGDGDREEDPPILDGQYLIHF